MLSCLNPLWVRTLAGLLLCVVPACQMHSVRTVGDEPMIMYLSVTPPLQPTHTFWSETGERLPHRFLPSSAYDVQTDTTSPIDELIDRHVAAELLRVIENEREQVFHLLASRGVQTV